MLPQFTLYVIDIRITEDVFLYSFVIHKRKRETSTISVTNAKENSIVFFVTMFKSVYMNLNFGNCGVVCFR